MSKTQYVTKGDKSKFNLTLSPLKESNNGNLTWIISPEVFDALQKVEVGGMLIVKRLAEKSRKHERSPSAYLEYVDKADVDAFKSKGARQTASDDVI